MRFNARRTSLVAVAALASSLVAAGCGGDGDSAEEANEVTIWSSMDEPVQAGLEKTLTAQVEEAGYTLDWQKVENINQLIMTKLQANDLPDIAFIPQPGVVADVVERGAGEPLNDVLDMAALEESMVPGTLEAGTIDDQLYGLLTSMNVKSLVFYNKKAFEEAGYEVPTSIDELNALTDQIKADGGTPWCMGIEDGTGTGWAATDWFEDLVMRYGGADGYNSWVTHETPFDSDLVREAAAEFEELMFTEGNVLGGQQGDHQHQLRHRGQPDVRRRARLLALQAGHASSPASSPRTSLADLDANVGVFGFPPAEAGGENPVLGGGDLAMMLDDSEATQAVMKLLAAPEIGEEAAGTSSFISPHKTFDVEHLPERDHPELRGRRLHLDGVPVRRLRPDARRGRCRVPSGRR